jgi:hypothetical protein
MTTQSIEEKANASIVSGDQSFAAGKFDNAKSAYEQAYQALHGAYGFNNPVLVPVLRKLVAVHYSKNAQGSTNSMKEMGRYLKIELAILQHAHGVRSAELIPTLEQLVIFYDFDGAHMLAAEVLQRIDDIKANLEVGQG